MKFVSKFGNLQIVLKPALEGSSLAGKLPEPGIYARFEGGLLETHDENIIARLRAHPAYDQDFREVPDDLEVAPQPGIEPQHDMIDIEYGHMGANKNPKPAVKLTPEVQKAIAEIATQMATEMFQKMVAEKGADTTKKEIDVVVPDPIEEEDPEKEGDKAPEGTAAPEIVQPTKPVTKSRK